MAREINSLGVGQYYGARDEDLGIGYTIGTSEREKNFEFPYDYANLPAVSADDQAVPIIPAGSVIVEAKIIYTTAFSGGTATKVDVGLYQSDGTVIDADGLINDGALTGVVSGAGAALNTVLAEDAQVVVALLTGVDAAGTSTAGEAKLYLKVILPEA